MAWVQRARGDKKLQGTGPYVVRWGLYMRGKKGGQIVARREKRFKTMAAAKKFAAAKRKNPKVYTCFIDHE